MPELFLHSADIHTALEQVGRERMTQGVATGRLMYCGATDRSAHGPLHGLLANVMSALDARSGIDAAAVGGENSLPAPMFRCIRVLSVERVR